MFVVGFLFQVAADFTKLLFRSNPANRGRICVMRACGEFPVTLTILARYSCGGVSLSLARQPAAGPVVVSSEQIVSLLILTDLICLGWATIISSMLTMLLLRFGSGIPTAEGDNLKRFHEAGSR